MKVFDSMMSRKALVSLEIASRDQDIRPPIICLGPRFYDFTTDALWEGNGLKLRKAIKVETQAAGGGQVIRLNKPCPQLFYRPMNLAAFVDIVSSQCVGQTEQLRTLLGGLKIRKTFGNVNPLTIIDVSSEAPRKVHFPCG